MTSLAAVGDLQLGDSSISAGFGLAARYAEDTLGTVFRSVREALKADVTFGNLETTLSTLGLEPTSWRSAQMRGRPGYARALSEVGFDVVNVANNHSTQHGVDAFWDTVSLLEEAGIQPCGIRGESPWTCSPAVVTAAAGATVGFVGYNLRPRQFSGETPPYAEGSAREIASDLGRLREVVDIPVVSLHWGVEFVGRPSAEEVKFARSLVDAGARLVLGHHPHVLRSFELYCGGMIAYSLGNFVGDMVWQDRLRRGAILKCEIDVAGNFDAEVSATFIDSAFRTEPDDLPIRIVTDGELTALTQREYVRAGRSELGTQRRAAYAHALRNLPRYPAGMLLQLGLRTARNKLAALRQVKHR